ncbi:MAG TPA: Na+/H+ antiporter subunit E [Acidimicrobiales bacterium]|jgi:multicomponent Na+:H+ antiporter subunit E|nr:Na+/H+ antiporter subunit E [Acidimicrobiales bacterium]
MSRRAEKRGYAHSVLALWIWGIFVWVLLTWTATFSQVTFGIGFALAAALACASLGPVARPWIFLCPQNAMNAFMLLGSALWRIVRANVSLARRVWLPSRPLRSGIVIVPTQMTADGGLTAVGLVTSIIVDNQLMDIDRGTNELQYHAVSVNSRDAIENYRKINGPIERRMKGLIR